MAFVWIYNVSRSHAVIRLQWYLPNRQHILFVSGMEQQALHNAMRALGKQTQL